MYRTRLVSVLLLLLSGSLTGRVRVSSHEEPGDWSCDSSASEIRVEAAFRPGIVTLDGHADDWSDVDGSEFSLLPAVDPDDDKEYTGGKMTVKALHDGKDVYFLLQVDGDYAYSKGEYTKCPSVALMFQIGDNATYHDMGGCKEGTDSCNSTTCKGHEVDIMHFSIGNAIPGRLYGGNPTDNRKGNGGDRFGHLVDLYAWTPHCRYIDGTGPSGNDTGAQNNWKGAWWHSSLSVHSGFVEEDSPYSSNGQKGTYYFELSRPLRTMDRIQQDVQFTLGTPTKMSAAFWYPVGGNPWHKAGHFSINCDWVSMDISSGRSLLSDTSLSTGVSINFLCSLLKLWAVLFCIISFSNASSSNNPVEAPPISPAISTLPAIPDIPLPANIPIHRTRSKHVSPLSAPGPDFLMSPAHPPNYGPLITSGHPPVSSRLPKPSMKRSSLVSAPAGSEDIAPSQYSPGAVPAGLAEPPLSPYVSHCCKPDMVSKRGVQGCHCVYPIRLDLLLQNVSQNPDWNIFLVDFAFQLGLRVSQIELINFYMISLSSLNISMDVTPHTGTSFLASDASTINSSLSLHKVHLRPSLVGDYKLLNFTWFKPPPVSPAPLVAASPVAAKPHQPSAPSSTTSDGGNHANLIFIIGIAAGIAIVLAIAMIVICVCTVRRRHTKTSEELGDKDIVKPRTVDPVPRAVSLSHPHPSSTRILAYEELKEATNNFSSSSILGEGGFGRVFKGVLSDGTAVAIKRLTTGGQQGDKEFLVEVEMLSRLHHRNLVKLVGYYSSPDSSQNLLCYELVPNGSLESWLHGHLGVNCPLDWDTRMKIALDAARGLAYLHEDSQPCVIHRDFKASNILLENNFHAKVADFGLAKQAPEGRGNYLSTRVMGTFGYVAPEYAMTGHLLVKSDVYSYGVVLLELLTGRKPVDMSRPSGQENLVTWARPILRDKDRLDELADPRLGGKYPKEDFVRVCTIAAACVAPEASQRPTMGEVVQSLKMVQRVTEYQDTTLQPTATTRLNVRQSSTTFESDGMSSVFSSGPYSGFSAFDNDNLSRTAVFSEDLHEGR